MWEGPISGMFETQTPGRLRRLRPNYLPKPVAAELSNREPTHEGSFQGGNLLFLARFPMSRKLDSAVLILLINRPVSPGHPT